MQPKFDLNKIKFVTDQPTFEKAVNLYENGKVSDFQEKFDGFSARVLGGNFYQVSISSKNFSQGSCDCYLGQNDYICKHMVAVAIHAVLGGKPIKKEDKEVFYEPKCSNRPGELSKIELAKTQKSISGAMKYIKSYNGPSRIWFAYQDSLIEGCNRLSAIVSELPVSRQTADLLVKMLLRLDKKLCNGGVDDSDGTVGGFMEELVNVLQEFSRIDHGCTAAFKVLKNQETSFGWEEPLLKLAYGIINV
ncbi:MAG: SWIM zinc finger family protein [Candidatus Moranbacteria bacterium]|nr:SWIM zinc finger family protein [Candidatus Moranbacteria bacterium]